MRKILTLLLTVSLFAAQQNSLHAQTDPTLPEMAPEEEPETVSEEEPVIDDTPVGEAAPVEESSGGGSSGGGALVVVGAVVVAAVIINNKRSKLEKTFVGDSATGTALTSVSSTSNNKLQWSLDHGSLSHDGFGGVKPSVNSQQQILNWRINRSWADGWETKTHFGLANNININGETQHRQWFSASVNKTALFNSRDNLSLSLGQRFDRNTTRATEGYFLPATFSSKINTNVFDLRKNIVENGRYINLSYIHATSRKSLVNLQWQYNPKHSGLTSSDSYMTVNWQYRY